MRIVARVFGFTFNFIRRIIFIILFAIFVASHTISSVSAAVSAFFDTVLGVQTVANLSQRLTRESDELAAARKKTADLESHNRKLSADVDDLKAKNVSLSRDVDDLKRKAAPDVNWKGKKMPLKDAVANVHHGQEENGQGCCREPQFHLWQIRSGLWNSGHRRRYRI